MENNEGSQNSTSQSSNKGKGKNKKWKNKKLEDVEKTTPSSNQQESLPQIQTRKGTLIKKRKSVPIARSWVMKNMIFIIKRLMS